MRNTKFARCHRKRWLSIFLTFAIGLVSIFTASPRLGTEAIETINLCAYGNAYEVYNSVEEGYAYSSSDGIWFLMPQKAAKASSVKSMRYRTIGYTLIISGSGNSYRVEIAADEFTDMMGETEVDGYLYYVHGFSQKKLQGYMESNGWTDVLADEYTVTAYPILTIINGGSTVLNGSVTQAGNGSVTSSGEVYKLYDGTGAFLKRASWGEGTKKAVAEWSSRGFKADFTPVTANLTYNANGTTVSSICFFEAPALAKARGDNSSGTYTPTTKDNGELQRDGKRIKQVFSTVIDIYAPSFIATKEGYTPISWNTKADGTGSKFMPGQLITGITGNTALYLYSKENNYHIEYDGNAPEGCKVVGSLNTQHLTYTQTASLTDARLLSCVGYEAVGWSVSADTSFSDYVNAKDNGTINSLDSGIFEPQAIVSKLASKQKDEETLRLYVIWKPIEVRVELNQNGGQNGTTEFYEEYNTRYTAKSRDEEPTQESISSVISPKKFGYDFTGYYTGYNGTGVKVVEGTASQTANQPSILYSNISNFGDYRFFSNETDNTLYADYTPIKSTITFDKQGGELGSTSAIETFGYTLPQVDPNYIGLTAPIREGYSFKGYYTKPNGAGQQYYNSSMAPLVECSWENDITLYAYWVDDIEPNVTFMTSSAWTKGVNGKLTLEYNVIERGTGIKEVKIFVDNSSTPYYTKSCGVRFQRFRFLGISYCLKYDKILSMKAFG